MKNRWVFSVYTMEMRKLLSYRLDFWIEFLGSVLIQFMVSYFLWNSLFETNRIEELQGMGKKGVMLYFLLAPLVQRIVCGPMLGSFSQEIYSGEFTRYLVYPVSFFRYKLATHLSYSTFFVVQVLLALVLFKFTIGFPEDFGFDPPHLVHIFQGLLGALVGGCLYFFMVSCLELVAFWADQVWSLIVMLRFLSAVLGGALIPLTLYPSQIQSVLPYLPFPYLFFFPIQTIQGKVPLTQYVLSLAILLFWAGLFYFICSRLYKRGTREYTGVGM